MIYLIGSLRNPEIPKIAERLRAEGYEVFDDWHAAGPCADDEWKRYEEARGHTYLEALEGHAAMHVFDFDLTHLTRANAALLVLPAGKSGHLEMGWMLGRGRPGFILLDNPDRWDVMYQFADGVHTNVESLLEQLSQYPVI